MKRDLEVWFTFRVSPDTKKKFTELIEGTYDMSVTEFLRECVVAKLEGRLKIEPKLDMEKIYDHRIED